MRTPAEFYDTDCYAWSLTTAALLRAEQWDALDCDREALAEERQSLDAHCWPEERPHDPG